MQRPLLQNAWVAASQPTISPALEAFLASLGCVCVDSSYLADKKTSGNGFDRQKRKIIYLSLKKRDALVQPVESFSWQREQLKGKRFGGGTEFSRNGAQ